jgi:hypothetical protein
LVACHFAAELLAAPVVADVVPDIEEEPVLVAAEVAQAYQAAAAAEGEAAVAGQAADITARDAAADAAKGDPPVSSG